MCIRDRCFSFHDGGNDGGARRLTRQKEGGPSGMIVEQIKLLDEPVLKELLAFFQKCFDNSDYPDSWAKAE
eukprot:5178728-Alexandrium_andersonii.AAC.1